MVTHISPVFCNFLIISVLFHFLLYQADSSEVEQTFLECSRSRDNTGESDTVELTVRFVFQCLFSLSAALFLSEAGLLPSALAIRTITVDAASVRSLSRPRLISFSRPPKTVAANMNSPSVFMAEQK